MTAVDKVVTWIHGIHRRRYDFLSDNPEPQELTTRQAAEWLTARGLRMSYRTVARHVDEGNLAAHKTPGGYRRIPLSALDKYLSDHS